MRFGEAIALQWRDLDLSRRLITIRRSWEGPTKGGKEHIFALQRILGDSTPTLTSDTYAHLANGYLAGAADRVRYAAPPALVQVISIAASGKPAGDAIPESKYVAGTRRAPAGGSPRRFPE